MGGVPVSLSEERALSEREGPQRERGAKRAVTPAGSAEERALREREGSQRERGARRVGRPALALAGLAEERV